MRKTVFAGILILTASTSHAQTGMAPAPAAPSAPGPAAAMGPANLCQELVAFMQAPPPAAAAPAGAAPAKPAAASPSGEGVPQKPSSKTESAQSATGHSGPAHEAPKQHAGSASEASAQKPELKSSLSAPVPKAPATVAKETILTVAEAQELAGTNDIRACRDAARKLRLAGVAMPPPLLALTALDLRYQQTAAPR
jgi:hypothetical protein